MARNLTKRTVDALPRATAPGGERYYDEKLQGFGIAVYPSGQRVFFVEYTVKGRAGRGARRRVALGPYGALDVDEAREEAGEWLKAARRGEDPLVERRQKAQVPTWSQWVRTYLAGVELRKKRPDIDRGFLMGGADAGTGSGRSSKKERRPCLAWKRWQHRQIDSITATEIAGAMEKMSERGRIMANRWLASVRACLQAAVREGILATNPAASVRLYRENPPRSRTLSDDERQRFLAAVERLTDPYARAAFKLLDQTGARMSEVLRARWGDFDLDAGLWRIPSPKAGHPQVVPLGGPTIALLRNLSPMGDYVIAGRRPDRPRADLKRAWRQVVKDAKLDGVGVHDLRRSFGLRVTRARGLHIASKLLRHADVRVTERVYAPLDIDELREAADHVARVLPMTTTR